jgi:TatD DNase family protein
MYFDAHNHLQDPWLTPHRSQVLADLSRAGVTACVVNGTSEQDWPEVTALGSQLSSLNSQLRLLPSYGLHPWNVGNASPHWRDALLRTLDANPHAFIGEIGLDRWILDRASPDDPRLAGLRRASLDEQLDALVWQLRLAAERNLPVTIHCLDAWGALTDVLRCTPLSARGFLLHAYGGSAELARDFATLGAYFSFNGAFLPPSPPSEKCHIMYDTSSRAARRLDVFRTLPLERLLVETDAPAMPLPASRRTHKLPDLANGNPINHPANLPAVYAGLAELRDLPLSSLTTQIAENFTRLFGPLPP